MSTRVRHTSGKNLRTEKQQQERAERRFDRKLLYEALTYSTSWQCHHTHQDR